MEAEPEPEDGQKEGLAAWGREADVRERQRQSDTKRERERERERQKGTDRQGNGERWAQTEQREGKLFQ